MNRAAVNNPLALICPACGAGCRFDVGDPFVCGTCGASFTVDDVLRSPPVRWGPSKDGYVESKCGRWRICPLFSGRVRPAWFELLRDGAVVERNIDTQRTAKARAAHLAIEALARRARGS
jgi:hypothetical protein